MITLIRTDSSHPDYTKLSGLLDKVLEDHDGDAHDFFAQFNTPDRIENVLIAYSEDIPVGCGAFKKYSEKVAEIKRMYVPDEYRGQGIAKLILSELESWALESGFNECILETGKGLSSAIGLYVSCGYVPIPNYDPYTGSDLSSCFKKNIR